MRAIPQKIYILKFIGEQGIVTVADVARHLFQSEKVDCRSYYHAPAWHCS